MHTRIPDACPPGGRGRRRARATITATLTYALAARTSAHSISLYIYMQLMYTIYIPYYTWTVHEFIYVADDGAAGPGTSTTIGATARLPRDSTSMLLGGGPARRRRRRCRRRRSGAAATAFLALARGSTYRAARRTRVHPLRTERGFLTRARYEAPLLARSPSVPLSHSPPFSGTHSFPLRSRPAREAELHAYNPFARPSFLPMFAPPAAALRVADEDNDATTAATRDRAMPPLPRTT